MDRVLSVGIVHKSYDGLGSFRNDDGRPGRFSIVPHKPCRLELGVDLLRERLDLEFLIVDVSHSGIIWMLSGTYIVPDFLLRDLVGDFTTT